MPRLTPLILLIMKSIPQISDVYLNYLKEDEALYNTAPIEVKRQIWSINNGKYNLISNSVKLAVIYVN